MNRRVLLGIVGWLVLAVAATTAGIATLDMLEDGITGKNVRPLDDEAIHRALSRPGATPTTPAPTLSVTPAGGVAKNLAAGGGTVTARCTGGKVTVVAVIPAQGFHSSGFRHDPAASVSLTLESDEEEYAVTVTCDNGTPELRSAKDDGHRRGRRGRG
ncbi:hypothetical protein [Actinomadura sp. DC4]|uniref:hypothetical protein n=1 Tax=Actinomadura sp. DC4 TaxID=3055069 RepID=UPI0025B16055|nr:hypothetical protein [Actinomadura sp. DC4]MDN3351490.1 hypothetical protein [Actinomadura sp. DC4]